MSSREPDRPRKRYDLATVEHDYPRWDGPPRRTLLICSHPRSGSTLLGEALYFAGGMGCPLEYFHRGFRPAFEQLWGTTGTADYVGALHRRRTDSTGTLAVKLFWVDVLDLATELDPVRFAALATTPPQDTSVETYRALAAVLAPIFPNPTFVHLVRADRARQAVSAAVAVQTGLWRSIPGVGEQDAIAEAEFDYDRIERLLAFADVSLAQWRNLFDAIGVAPYGVTYEDLARDFTGTMTGVFRHLGSDATPAPGRMRRQSDDRSEALLIRFLRENARRAALATR